MTPSYIHGFEMPGWFTNRTFQMPERLTVDEARERRLNSTLTRIRKEQERLRVELPPLSPANKFYSAKLKEFEVKFSAEIADRRARVRSIEKNAPHLMKSRTYIAAVSGLSQLMQRRSALQQRAAAERRANVFKASAADGRFFNPFEFQNPRSVFGTEARTRYSLEEVTRRLFVHPVLSIPCVQRAVRRAVMFARKKAGRGHRGRRRWTVMSMIGC